MGSEQRRQKEIYDAKVHGKPFSAGDLVWLFNPAVPRGQARKFHRPWVGPYKVLDRVSKVTYRIQHTYTRRKTVVHFDRLELCHQGTRLPQQGQLPNPLKPQQHPDVPRTGEGLELLEPEPPADPPQHVIPVANDTLQTVSHPAFPTEYGTYSLKKESCVTPLDPEMFTRLRISISKDLRNVPKVQLEADPEEEEEEAPSDFAWGVGVQTEVLQALTNVLSQRKPPS